MRRIPRGRIATASGVFALAWIVWSGHFTPLMLAFGLVSCLLVLGLAWRIGFFDAEIYSLGLGPRLPAYWLWLLVEIARANWAVARIVLSPRLPISPTLATIDASALPQAVQATLANAITLTPGSLTLDVDAGLIEVHCLTRAAADALLDGEMFRRAAALTKV